MVIDFYNMQFNVDEDLKYHAKDFILTFKQGLYHRQKTWVISSINCNCIICGESITFSPSQLSGKAVKNLINNLPEQVIKTCSRNCSYKLAKQNTKKEQKYCSKCKRITNFYGGNCQRCLSVKAAKAKYQNMTDKDKMESTKALREARAKAWQKMTSDERSKASEKWWSKGMNCKNSDYKEKHPEEYRQHQINAGLSAGKVLKKYTEIYYNNDYDNPYYNNAKQFIESATNNLDKANQYWIDHPEEHKAQIERFVQAGQQYWIDHPEERSSYKYDENGYITHICISKNNWESINLPKSEYYGMSDGSVTSDRNKAIKAKYKDNLEVNNIGELEYSNHIWIPIEEYYENIKKQEISFEEEEFSIIPTGRSQNSITRNSLLDNYLVKKGVSWFVYIKFDELGHPLVIGKSGSKLVNVSGCDVIFDKNPDGGPARQYLIDNNLDWDKTQIAIFRCNTEQDALKKEKEIHDKYGLFYS